MTFEEKVKAYLERKGGKLEFVRDMHKAVSDQLDTGNVFYFLDEIFDDHIIVKSRDEFFKVSYEINDKEEIQLSSEKKEVEKKITYEKDNKNTVKITASRDKGDLLKESNFDDEALVIRNASLLGSVSANGYTFTESAMKDAERLLENGVQYLNHPQSESDDRDISKLVSSVKNVRFVSGESKVRGDIHFVDTPHIREEIFPRLKHFKDKVGNSIVGEGISESREDGEFVTSLHAIESVDLVTDPATNRGLFEGIKKVKEGSSLASLLNDLIDSRSDSRSDVINRMASAAGIEPSTVNQILSGSINCPPMERLAGFATALNTSTKRLEDAAKRDGCEFNAEEAIRFKQAIEKSEEKYTGGKGMKVTLEDLKKDKELYESLKKQLLSELEESKKIEDLEEEKEFLAKENKTLKSKVDEYEVKEKLEEKKALASKLLSESKLPEVAITDQFKTELVEDCENETQMKAKIADRESVIEAINPERKYNHRKDLSENKDKALESDAKFGVVNGGAA